MRKFFLFAALLAALIVPGVSAQAKPAQAVKPAAIKAFNSIAVKAAAIQTIATPSCCVSGTCCAMPICCPGDGTCCDAANGVCTAACGCPSMSCCAE